MMIFEESDWTKLLVGYSRSFYDINIDRMRSINIHIKNNRE